MRDHLDDPTPPPGDRAAVAVRAHRLRLRRRGVLAGAGTTTVVALVVLAVAVHGGSSAPSRLAATDPATTSAQTPSEGASPSVPATPGPTASAPATRAAPPVAVALPPPAASPTPSPACESTKYLSCPDGQPGYGEGDSLDSCYDATSVPQGAASADLGHGIVATLALPAAATGGAAAKGSLTFRNDGAATARVSYLPSYGGDDGSNAEPTWDADVVGAAVHEGHGPWPAVVSSSSLAPDQSVSFVVELPTSQCGDNQDQNDQPMPAGSYDAGLELRYAVAAEAQGSAAPTPTPAPTADQTTALGGTLHIT